jgi:hypothetical protein
MPQLLRIVQTELPCTHALTLTHNHKQRHDSELINQGPIDLTWKLQEGSDSWREEEINSQQAASHNLYLQ